jgi:3,4-dihydroxy 2-butanone 4-phosphate synthase/GTP cyclohydrolase II
MSLFSHLVSTRLPAKHGQFIIDAFDSGREEQPHLALHNDGVRKDVVNVRLHSECITGDVFGSTRCDCGEQLNASLAYLQQHGGVLIYLRQEGRGIGLVNKLKAYNLQDEGYDTIVANHQLGFATDLRNYEAAVAILKHLGVTRINLLTNNPEKLEAFENSGIHVESRIPIVISPVADNERYLRTKKDGMGHMLGLYGIGL